MAAIGVISDTHGLLRPEAVRALEGSDLIVHAGDVGGHEVLDALARIAPVRAVCGNMDRGALSHRLPQTDVVDLTASDGAPSEDGDGPLAYVLHDLADLDLAAAAAGFRVVVSGHTHRPLAEERNGVLYVNPGSAGPRRLELPVTVGRLKVDGEEVAVEIVELAVGG